MLNKLKHATHHFLTGLIYPFLQKGWPLRMWIFGLLSYVPVVNLIIARGWRLEMVHRVGWEYKQSLPEAKDIFRFFVNGILLWSITGLYILFPFVLVRLLGLEGWSALYEDAKYVIFLFVDLLTEESMTFSKFSGLLGGFIVNELLEALYAFLIHNIWLVIYIPLYRVAMVRFALTKNLLLSHFSLLANFRFVFRNFIDIILLYVFMIVGGFVTLAIDGLLAMSVIGIPLIPIVTTYMYFWYTGYEYGMLGRKMAVQEKMELAPRFQQLATETTSYLPNFSKLNSNL